MPLTGDSAVGTIHIIGAGMAGLSAAVRLTGLGFDVRLHEAAGHAGGRCRSFYDETLGCRIDNGNHLLLSGNWATQEYLTQIGSNASLAGPDQAEFPFIDLKSGEKWTVKPDKGRVPWSLFSRKTRVPGSTLFDYLRGISLAWAAPQATISQCLKGNGLLYQRFWEPLAVSVLNTEANSASAKLLWPVLLETFGRGAAACIPLIVKEGLSESFVDPALSYLDKSDAVVTLNHRLKELIFDKDQVIGLVFNDSQVEITNRDRVILAVPPTIANKVVPGLIAPNEFRSIVNAHYRIPETGPGVRFMGMVGGDAHWLFVRKNIVSVTVSAATELSDLPSDDIAVRLWSDVCKAMELGDLPMGKYRIVKEKRATFAQTPEQLLRRPSATSAFKNMYLAGDWTDNSLPATIEGAIRSGFTAADLANR